jgi:hypothetical protein
MMNSIAGKVWFVAGVCAAIGIMVPPLLGAEPEKPAPQFTKPPKGAIVLFNGKDASGWVHLNGKPCNWKVEDGILVCTPRSGNIKTKKTFGDQKLHIEFRCPLMPEAKGQARGNSGVYIQGIYEVQVLDSFGIDPIKDDDCGGIYKQIAPKCNACMPPKEWQSYDITFHAPKLEEGKVVKKARITVVQNGITIIDDKEIGPTPGGIGGQYRNQDKPGPLMLQDHGNLVAFRNIWIQPLK